MRLMLRVVLVVGVLLVSQLLGNEVLSWCAGGEGGTVNLPGIANNGSQRVNQAGRWRVGYRMADIEQGLRLALPSSMPQALAVFSNNSGFTVPNAIINRELRITGRHLIQLRDADVTSFEVTFVSIQNETLLTRIELQPGETSFEVYVR